MDSQTVRRRWADRFGAYSPTYYAHYGPNETSEYLRRTVDRYLPKSAAILELGCSAGRHLAHLHEHGYRNLVGIDINGASFDVMAESYPELATTGTYHHAAIEDVIPGFDDGQFEAIFSVQTLQHLHPDAAWIYDEIARITDDLLLTAEIEGATGPAGSRDAEVTFVDDAVPLYYRDWRTVFDRRGFDQVSVEDARRGTIRVFRKR